MDIVEKLRNTTCGEISCEQCNEEREEAAQEIEKLRNGVDTGPWHVIAKKSSSEVILYSDDFVYDAQMKLTGDFSDFDSKVLYAKKLVETLNNKGK